ncbi:MAG: hypothetical protein PHE21_03855 [Candidatus Dojkabacteria bacterium]|nr:hypothetical protein [Candidatus Dojkabacteria bacterium]
MILKHRLLEKYSNYQFKIPVGRGDKVLVEENDIVKVGTELLRKKTSTITYSFYIPDQIGCPIERIKEYITCMDGQFVDAGEVLAEKPSMSGLTVKKLISPSAGVIDMSRLEGGYLDLFGEEKEYILKSTFEGVVSNVNTLDSITVKASSIALDLLAISKKQNDTNYITGDFVSIGNSKDVILRTDERTFEDKIVFVGKHLHPELLQDLFEKGAKFVLTYSMNYPDFRNQGLPVGVIGGFGEMYSSDEIVETISSMNGKFAIVDFDESQIFFVTEKYQKDESQSLFVHNLIGKQIISHSLGNYGMVGEVVGVEDDDIYITVQWGNGSRSIINMGSVEFISY